ncbi:DUF4399 domain-containing protein [Pseudotabrizicola alkalilacus]|uniref:DUF4399 domain-containing protein n=1 Tax=Pseudotabrizicola alkalilacus TaxID=2305252 RepID=UPI00338FDB19
MTSGIAANTSERQKDKTRCLGMRNGWYGPGVSVVDLEVSAGHGAQPHGGLEPKPTLHRALFVQTDQRAMSLRVGRLPIFLGGNYEELDFRYYSRAFGLPATDEIVHFGGGQTQVTKELPAGTHTLQRLLGDWSHVPHNPPVMSEVITITVN